MLVTLTAAFIMRGREWGRDVVEGSAVVQAGQDGDHAGCRHTLTRTLTHGDGAGCCARFTTTGDNLERGNEGPDLGPGARRAAGGFTVDRCGVKVMDGSHHPGCDFKPRRF